MKTIPPFCLGLILIFCSACMKREEKSTPLPGGDLVYSTSYRAPFFEEGTRLEKIRQALAGSDIYYRECAEINKLPGIAYGLVVDDSLIFYGGHGSANLESGTAATEKTLFRIASMTKSFTAMAILMLRDEGKLELSDPVSLHLPDLSGLTHPTGDSPPVRIFDLLTMTAGFPEDNPWGDRFLDMGDEELLDRVSRGISFSSVPATRYEYSNLGYGLLGQVISRVSGQAYQEYITQHILQALGMTHTYWEYSQVPGELLAQGYRREDDRWLREELLHDGAFGAMGGLITSIEDFSKYLSFHLSAWPPRNDPDTGPLSRSSLREMHRMNNPRFYQDPAHFLASPVPFMRGYGLGLVSMLDQEGNMEVGHNGGLPGFGSSYSFFPQCGLGIMAFSNLTYVGGAVRSANYRILEELKSQGLFLPRRLPVSEILEQRKEEVERLLLTWDPELEREIVAANLYLDIPREKRMEECRQLLELLGPLKSTGPLIPENQLRGSFLLRGEKQSLRVYFTLSPEAVPRVQWLSLEPLL